MKREPTPKQEMVDERKLLSEQLKQLEQKEKRIKAAYQTALILWKNTKKTKSSLEMSRNSWNYVSAITSLLRRQIFPKRASLPETSHHLRCAFF